MLALATGAAGALTAASTSASATASGARHAPSSKTTSRYGDPTWQSVKTFGVRSRGKVTFRAVAADLNTVRYRVSLGYKDTKKPVSSKPVRVMIWRRIPLSEYDPNYENSGLLFGETAINGEPRLLGTGVD